MATSIADKLRIKKGFTLFAVNAPAEFKKNLNGLPPAVKIITSGKVYNQVHWFVMNKAQMEKELNKVLALVKDDVVL